MAARRDRARARTTSGSTETLFANANGYIGMRANPSEGRDAHTHGTYLNGFHETWQIQHAEDAFAFAKTGQTIVNVPDAKLIKLYVDDEPLLLGDADLDHYERAMDFRTGVSYRELVWRTPAGKRVRVRSERMVCLEHRHLAVMRLEVTLLDGNAPIVISSQLLNRQDGEDEYHVSAAALGEGSDPRQAREFDHRVLEPKLQRHGDRDDPAGGEVALGYRCTNSGMTMACAYRHEIETPCSFEVETSVDPRSRQVGLHDPGPCRRDDPAHQVRRLPLVAGHPAARAGRPLPSHARTGARRPACRSCTPSRQHGSIGSGPTATSRWSATEPPSRRSAGTCSSSPRRRPAPTNRASPPRRVTGGGYDGHYFWDTEVYVLPFLAYTNPDAARKLLRFRFHMLDAARARAAELSQVGALYPWRTINGEEASAYYAAGTAQYHINAAVVYALERYLNATGDVEFLATGGRRDPRRDRPHVRRPRVLRHQRRRTLPHPRRHRSRRVHDGRQRQPLHERDGPLHDALRRPMRRVPATSGRPTPTPRSCARTGVTDDEIAAWHRACDAMYVPYDEELGIHPQDASFLERERWDFEGTPPDKYPLLLHFHPLVIYRHQVLKQADVVLAMFLRGEHFAVDQKRRNFDYYDPITTGDSSLSACVQSIVAAEVGHARPGVRLLRPVALPRPRRHPRQHRRRCPHRQRRRCLGGAGARIRRAGRQRRPPALRTPTARRRGRR